MKGSHHTAADTGRGASTSSRNPSLAVIKEAAAHGNEHMREASSAAHETTKGAVRVDGEYHRRIGTFGGRVLMVNSRTNAIFLAEGQDGLPILPTQRQLSDLIESGRIVGPNIMLADPDASGCEPESGAITKLVVECDMLEQAGVPMGEKAMAIWLHANWTPALIKKFGTHSSVATLRRWRATYRKAAK